MPGYRQRWSRVVPGVALVMALSIGLAACSSSKKSSTTTTSPGQTTTTVAPKHGGTLIFAAEQWPSCINPITQCAQSSWLQWLVPIHVLPRLMELDANGNFVPSPLLTGAPTLSQNPFTVTYHLNPNATWQPDGTPITSADVAFTEQAYMKSTGSLSTAGYADVTKVLTPDPQTVKVVFDKTYADWADVFGGFSGVVLEAKQFKTPNTANVMQTGITFSGGPWILQSFGQNQEVLVPNTKYWDASRIPVVDKVVFVPKTETAVEIQALKSGEVAVDYPQPSTDSVKQLQGAPGITTAFGVTPQYENLWFNEKAGHPFADKNVRAAFSYAFDRQKFLDDIVKPFDPKVQMLNCAAWVPAFGSWCDNTQFADVQPDAAKVASFMQAAGYAKDSSGMWAKGGKELTIKWSVTAGNSRREDTQAEFIPLLKAQGFNVVTDNSTADTLFQQRLPTGDYDMAMFINVTGTDPTVTSIGACDQIPGPANKGQGQNDYWWCNQAATALMHKSDAELNVATRTTEIHQVGAAMRADYYDLPLYAFPAMVSYQPSKVSGPVTEFVNSPESVFWNMWAWSVP